MGRQYSFLSNVNRLRALLLSGPLYPPTMAQVNRVSGPHASLVRFELSNPIAELHS